MLFLIALFTTVYAYYKNLYPLVEVGKADCTSYIRASNLNSYMLPLGASKSDRNYQYATSINSLTHDSYNNLNAYQRYSIFISGSRSNNTQTQLYIKVRTNSDGSAIRIITIRWLVIDTKFSAFKVFHFSFNHSSGPQLSNYTSQYTPWRNFTYSSGSYSSWYSFSGIDVKSSYCNNIHIYMTFQHSGQLARIRYISDFSWSINLYGARTQLLVLNNTNISKQHPEYQFNSGSNCYYGKKSIFGGFGGSGIYRPYNSPTNSSGIFMGMYYLDLGQCSFSTIQFDLDVDSNTVILDLRSQMINRAGLIWFDFIPMMNCTTQQLYNSSVHECQFCPIGQYANTTSNTCMNCLDNFDNCTECNSTTCSKCDTLYYLQNNACVPNCSLIDHCASNGCQLTNTSVLNCTTCANPYMPGNNYDCIVNCSQVARNCSDCNATTCLDCSLPYYLLTNNSCAFNCSSIVFCDTCHVDDSNQRILCDTCDIGYELFNTTNTCESVCGNGIVIISDEQCDDNNTEDGDGCSSLCKIQPYFNCTNTTNNYSVCTLQSLDLKVICIVKNEQRNQFTLTLQLKPQRLPFYQNVNWRLAFDSQLVATTRRLLNQLQDEDTSEINQRKKDFTIRASTAYSVSALQANYDSYSNRVRILLEYYNSLQSQNFALAHTLWQMHPILQNIPPFTVALPQYTRNNLSLFAFSETDYLIAKIVKYLAIVVAALTVLLFLFGYLGAKLTALEGLATVQLTAILLLSLKDMSAAFGQLKYLNYSLGVTPIFFQNYFFQYSTLPVQANNIFFNRNILTSINICWAVVAVPALVAMIIKILTVTKYKESNLLLDAWKNALGTYTFYGLFFLAYGEFALLALNVRFIQMELPSYIGMSVGAFFFILMTIYVVMSHKKAKHFGSFKNRFYRFEVSQYVYTFSALQRFVTAFLVVCLGPKFVTAAIPCCIFVLEIIFLAVKKPYFQSGLRSALAKKIVSVVICLLFMVSNFVNGDSIINSLLPLIILVILLVIVVFSWVVAVGEVKKNIKEWKQKLIQEPQRKYKDIELQLTDKHKLILKDFRDQMRVKQQGELANLNQSGQKEQVFQWKPVLHDKIDFDKYNWDNYDKLYSMDQITTMKNKIRKLNSVAIISERSEEDTKTPQHIKLVQKLTKQAQKRQQPI